MPHYEPLNEKDLDVLSGLMIIFLNAAERIIHVIELAYEAQYRAGKEYKTLVRMYGKMKADQILHDTVQKIVRGDDRNKLGKILKSAKEMHYHMESLNKSGREAHDANTTECQAFDAIISDTNFLCYLYALMGNCREGDGVTILSTVKILAKEHYVSDRILDRLKEPLNLQSI